MPLALPQLKKIHHSFECCCDRYKSLDVRGKTRSVRGTSRFFGADGNTLRQKKAASQTYPDFWKNTAFLSSCIGCCTVVKRTPPNQDVMGSNPNGYLSSVPFKRPFEEEKQH